MDAQSKVLGPSWQFSQTHYQQTEGQPAPIFASAGCAPAPICASGVFFRCVWAPPFKNWILILALLGVPENIV